MPTDVKLSDPDNGNTPWQIQNGVMTIVDLAVTLDQKDMGYVAPPNGVAVQGTLDVVVQAETVTLTGPLVNPGRKVTIICHRLVVNPGASIDVSGAVGSPDWPLNTPPNPTDTDAGAAGANGADGGAGGAGGAIIIHAAEITGAADGAKPALLILNAEGGAGGAGQEGGSGQVGVAGQPGVTPTWNGGSGYGPGWGGQGGAGGNAGNGGVGGVGGSIVVNVIAPVDPASITLQVGGGAGGHQGQQMPGATGGMGIPPSPDQQGGGMGPEGPPGAQGQPGATGGAGSGALTPAGKFTAADLGQQASLALLHMIQQNADSTFLAKTYATAAALYGQLIAMTEAAASQAAAAQASGATVSPDVAARAAINRACVCELSRMKQGLDFFGLRPDWAPTLTLSVLQAEIMAMLTLAGQFEQALTTLLDENAAAEARLQTLQNAQSQAGDRLTATQAQITALQAQLNLFVQSLGRQQQEINDQLGEIQQMQFEDVFAQQHHGCTTIGALNTCMSVVSTALSVENAYSDVTEAVGVLADSGTIVDGIKNGIAAITTVENSITSIQSGYAGIKSLIDPANHPDGGKMLTNEADYDDWVDQNIVGCAQQDDLKSAARRYFDLVKTRNNNVLTYNASLLQLERLSAEADQQTAAFEAIAAQLAAENNPGDPTLTALMMATDVQLRTYLLRRINDEIRALNYWTVNNDGGGASGVTMPTSSDLMTLSGAQTAISQAIDVAMTNGLPDPFQALSITFTRAQHPDAFKALAASTDRKLMVRSDVAADGAAFAGMAHVTVERVAVTLPEYSTLTSGVLHVILAHGGSGVFLEQDGSTSVRFTHAIHSGTSEYDFQQKLATSMAAMGNTEAGFLGLSPFTDWIIDFGPTLIDIDFSTLSQVQLTFIGCSVPAQDI